MDLPTAQRLGTALAPIWREPQEWVHRAVESVSFLDAGTIRRSRSFDLTVPEHAPAFGDHAVLPLALLDRRVLAELDVMDDSGKRVPLLTSRQNGAVSAAILVAAAAAEDIRDPAVTEVLRPIAMRQGGDVHAALNLLRQAGASPGLLASTMALAEGFIVYVLSHARPGTRTIIKLAYSEPLTALAVARTERWLQLLAWAPLEVQFDIRAAGEADSYHFEIHAPPGGTVLDAALAVATQEQELLPAQLPVNQVAAVAEPGRLAHLHVIGAPQTATGRTVARLVPAKGGWISNAVAAGWFAAAVLVATWALRERLRVAQDSSVTLLLVVNGIISAVATRTAPHDLTAALIRGPRALTLALGGASFVSAALLVLGLRGAALSIGLVVSAVVATVCALILHRAWLTSR